MENFRLLRPEEVIERWPSLSTMLNAAVQQGNGEVEVDDLLKLVLGGKMFILADEHFALTCEFMIYPQKVVCIVGFGSGKVRDRKSCVAAVEDFARRGGASSLQTYCRHPGMVRYYKRFLNVDPLYAVLEKNL
jgi:hypothetical protein